jgi:hypothetical protein
MQARTQEGNHNDGQEENNQEDKKKTMTMTVDRMNTTKKT